MQFMKNGLDYDDYTPNDPVNENVRHIGKGDNVKLAVS